ncbi:MAG: hypothetical protein GXY80_08500 [Syntrophorhabdus aromaticivorans]|uniref:DUF1743 domain-containing protein n=1 Tax=Syntrophorhabdus aromaticivorans TaxID=328301 RepID=A0A351TYV0_9BACT|nr:hypothetical protein [Syntrophorhabdus aromaticivorans]HBA52881.1 hypothetical protein [Syntrophorhabdus aromaticivorans]
MRVYVGFDDTDNAKADRGTGKLARWFEGALPGGCRLWGVVRQQLLVDPRIPYTSHNSSACAIVDCEDPLPLKLLIERAVSHIERHSLPGSDPGLCVATESDRCLSDLTCFGLECAKKVLTQGDALKAVDGAHLSGHGGTNDGIIGAAAGVGLTAWGWSGRFIEYGRGGLRSLPKTVSVGELEDAGIGVISLDRDAHIVPRDDLVDTGGWLRPRLLGGKAVLPVMARGEHLWESPGRKRSKEHMEG